MERKNLGFKYLNLKHDVASWTSCNINNISLTITDNTIKLFEPDLKNHNIKNKSIIKLISYKDFNYIKYDLNVICYSIEFLNKLENTLSYIYIPKNVLDNFVREEKLKRILNDN